MLARRYGVDATRRELVSGPAAWLRALVDGTRRGATLRGFIAVDIGPGCVMADCGMLKKAAARTEAHFGTQRGKA